MLLSGLGQCFHYPSVHEGTCRSLLLGQIEEKLKDLHAHTYVKESNKCTYMYFIKHYFKHIHYL